MQSAINLAEQRQEEPQSKEDTVTPGKPTTALAPLAEPVIEGEVTAIIEPEQPQKPKQQPYYLLPLCTLLVCLLIVGVVQSWQLLTPSATVVIIPREEHISLTTSIPIRGRLLPALTLSQSTTVPATGHGYQAAKRAHGYIILYNGSLSEQTIANGTIVTGSDGIQIATDQTAYIPPASPPTEGAVSVLAHAVVTGTSGNIPAGDISVALTSDVLAKNLMHFRGGQDERSFSVVTKSDIASAAAGLQATLIKSERAALNAQLDPGEALLPHPCSEQVTSDHKAGEEAREVRVTLSETCSSIAYSAHTLYMNATQMVHEEAIKRFGTGYRLAGDMQMNIIHTTITDQTQGIATLMVKLDAIYIYHLSAGERLHILHLIEGMSKNQAIRTILHMPGIQGAAINSNAGALPTDPGSIRIIVLGTNQFAWLYLERST